MDYNISSVLKQLRKTAGYSANDTIEQLKEFNIDISVKTLYGYESGLSMPNANVFVALCKIYHCDNPMVLFGNTSFDKTELTLLEKYRALDSHGKKSVEAIISNELERCSAEYSPNIRQFCPFSNDLDRTYYFYRKDYVEEYYKGSTTNRYFNVVDIFDYFTKEISDEELAQRVLSKSDIDAHFRTLDSFSSRSNKPTTNRILNAANEHTNNDTTGEIKNTEDFIAAVRTITRAQLDYINATDDTGSPEQKSATSGISIDKEKAAVNGKFPFKLKSTSGTVVQPSQLVDAAHERTDIEVTEDMKKHDNDIMDDKNF